MFGLPVLALEMFGRSLGGAEAERWVAILQGLLSGWVVYVGAGGMLFEGALWLSRRRLAADLLPAATAAGLYLLSIGRIAAYALTTRATPAAAARQFPPPWFHWAVIVLIVWTGFRWWHSSHGARARD